MASVSVSVCTCVCGCHRNQIVTLHAAYFIDVSVRRTYGLPYKIVAFIATTGLSTMSLFQFFVITFTASRFRAFLVWEMRSIDIIINSLIFQHDLLTDFVLCVCIVGASSKNVVLAPQILEFQAPFISSLSNHRHCRCVKVIMQV